MKKKWNDAVEERHWPTFPACMNNHVCWWKVSPKQNTWKSALTSQEADKTAEIDSSFEINNEK